MPVDAVTTAEAARLLGVATKTVARVCAAHNVGTLLNPRMRVLSPEDVETLRNLIKKPGNPNFGKPGVAEQASAARWAKPPSPPTKKKPKAARRKRGI